MKRSLRVLGVTTSLTFTKADRFLVSVAKKNWKSLRKANLFWVLLIEDSLHQTSDCIHTEDAQWIGG